MIFSKEITESATLKFASAAREINKTGEKVISLGLGEPDFPTPEHIIEATYRAMQDGFTRYSSPMGLLELREAICAHLVSQNSINASPDDIIVTPGAKQAILLSLMAILEPEDEVIVLTPCYVSYVPCVKIAEPNSKVIEIPLLKDDLSIPVDEIKSNITEKTKLIMLNTPNNPTGRIFSSKELESIVELAALHGIYILSDEIYDKLNYSGDRVISPSSIGTPKNQFITVNGFSKAYSMTGWRIGYAAFPSDLKSKYSRLQQHINTNTCTFVQKGAIEALVGSQDHIRNYNNLLRERSEAFTNIISNQDVVSFVPPKGGLFAFLNIEKTGIDSNTFAANLISEMKVAVTPGIAFGRDWDGFVRVSFATHIDDLKEGAELICRFASTILSRNKRRA